VVNTLGGVQEMSKNFEEGQKLQLKFNFNNFYSKPCVSTEPIDSTGLLIKLKVRKYKDGKTQKVTHAKVVSSDIVGICSKMYKFQTIFDYQYLPIQRNEKTGETECIYDQILPDDISVGPSWFRNDQNNLPLFLPPSIFSRTEIAPTILRNEQKLFTNEENEEILRFAITSRTSRSYNGTTVSFDMTSPIPLQPKEGVKESISSKSDYEALVKLFDERPIWTLAAVKSYFREPPKKLSLLLTAVAYYYNNGPWRNCFVRYGYDPRKHFESRFYQMLDFRVRATAGFKGESKRKRPSALSTRVRVSHKISPEMDEDAIEKNFQLRRAEAIFTNDSLPPFRARHYQFIDIHIENVQDMLQKVPTMLMGASCNEKRGWLPNGFIEDIRNILTDIAQANMLKLCKEQNMTVEDYNDSQTDKTTNADDDDTDSNEDDFIDSDADESNFDASK
jgi:general transcription factor 3C polypeptide 5 (transcription factor C subunit 1)